MLRGGSSVPEVSRALGLRDGTVRGWARWAGVEPRRLRAFRRISADPRTIPAGLGCGHTRVARRALCGSCRIDVMQGRAVVL